MHYYAPSVTLDLELQNRISEKIGNRDKAKEVMSLLMSYGINVITKCDNISIQLPNLEIQSLTPQNAEGAAGAHVARRHLFVCKINGQPLPMLRRVELDPFDYNDGEVFEAKLTILPMVESNEKEEEG